MLKKNQRIGATQLGMLATLGNIYCQINISDNFEVSPLLKLLECQELAFYLLAMKF